MPLFIQKGKDSLACQNQSCMSSHC